MLAGVLHVNSYKTAGCIEIKHNAISDFIAVLAWFVIQMDVQRICIRIV